jgi:acyl-CoA synthetase (AMP-forming)/AMP-acid ligase II
MLVTTTLGNIARPHLAEHGGKIALRDTTGALTYLQFEHHACQVANGLAAAGVGRGDRVAYLGKNSLPYFEVLIGAAKIGAVMVPINWRLAAPEVAALLADCNPRWLLAAAAFKDLALSLAPRITCVDEAGAIGYAAWRDAHSSADPGQRSLEGEAALQLYTSGTTGRAKGAVLTHQSLFGLREQMNPRTMPAWYQWSADDVSLIAMPAAHISGTGWGIWTLAHGATGIVAAEFDPHAVFDMMVKHRINKIMMVPTAIQIAIRHPQASQTDFSFLKFICYGGAPMPAALLEEAMKVFGCGFVQMYGMTETSGTIVALPPEQHLPGPRLASVGLPLPGVELKICDAQGRECKQGETGEIVTRSIANMGGYFNLPDETSRTVDTDGWLRTGDAGYLDEGGYLFLRDRVKDMIITGGENVYPAEVENALRSHPGVLDVAVIGVPDAVWGERVTAVVVVRAEHPPDANALIEFARARIARYKCPKQVEFAAELPRNAAGKILRRELRDRYKEQHERTT